MNTLTASSYNSPAACQIEPDARHFVTLPEPQKTYLLEEQKQRRAEIEKLIERIENDQRYGLVITGLVWSWLATQNIAAPFNFVTIALPPILILFFIARWRLLHKQIRDVANYTMQLEMLFGLPLLPKKYGFFGWELCLHSRESDDQNVVDPNIRKRHKTGGDKHALAWWILLFIANLAIAGIYVCVWVDTH